jgi:hypothetical protein
MPHLIIEVARSAVERRLLGMPIEFDQAGAPADILAPPAPIRRTTVTPLGTVRVQLIVRTVSLGTVAGSAQCVLTLGFDDGSIEALSLGQAAALLAGQISIPFGLMTRAALADAGKQIAELCADFSLTNVGFALDGPSYGRLTTAVGAAVAPLVVAAVGAALTTQFRQTGVQATGLRFNYTPVTASEDLLTVDELPGVVWVDSETLALSLRYAPQSFPPPFQPVPFLPAGQSSAFGIWLSNDGFQRTVRNPAVRRLARDMLSARLIDGFVQNAYAARGGGGGITDADKAEGKRLLDEYLKTPQGLADLANETPAPLGQGMLRKRVMKVPDPFSDFDVEIPELDLWLGHDRIEGRAVVRGKVNGFSFRASIRFRARPVLVQQPVAIELHDVQIDDPDLDISLPFWLEWAVGIIVGLISGPVMGVVVGFLLADIIAALAEAFFPSDLGSKVPQQDPKPVRGLPAGVTLTELTTVPERLAIAGDWAIYLDDPRPFNPMVRIVDRVDATKVGEPRTDVAWFACLGVLGIVADSSRERGAPFNYQYQQYRSRVTLSIDSMAVPLPLTYFPWTIAIGYRSMEMYHFPVFPAVWQPLVAGPMAVTADVWHPEPPIRGAVAQAQFVIDIQGTGDTQFTLDVPPEAGCILIGLRTKVVDASGATWNLYSIVDVPNETVTFGDDFRQFGEECKSHRKEWKLVEEPSLLDKVWNPPDVYYRALQRAIRTEQPAVTAGIAEVLEIGQKEAFTVLLAPSLMKGR